MFQFHTRLKQQKTFRFLVFEEGGIKWEHWQDLKTIIRRHDHLSTIFKIFRISTMFRSSRPEGSVKKVCLKTS